MFGLPTRRSTLQGAAALAVTGPITRTAPSDLASIERATGGRLGVAAINLRTGARLAHRGAERFPMCSTFKPLAVAAVLKRVERFESHLDRPVRFSRADLVPYSPVTEAYADAGAITLREACAAAIEKSDNTAGNLLLREIGGPQALTRFCQQQLRDSETRLDRWETELNSALPGDPRDTTTPAAMLETMRKILVGDAMMNASRVALTEWMVGATTGFKRLRAGVPSGWRVGDKTGAGANGTVNDVAIVWTPKGTVLLIASYLTGATVEAAERDAAHAQVAWSAVNALVERA